MIFERFLFLFFLVVTPISLAADSVSPVNETLYGSDVEEKAGRPKPRPLKNLRKALNIEIAARASADTAETLARIAADTVEAQARKAADDALTVQVNGIKHTVGEAYSGGYVFYVYDGGQHGLIVTGIDLSVLSPSGATVSDFKWGGFSSGASPQPFISNAIADGIGAGKANTAFSIAAQIAHDNATIDTPAMLCHFHRVTQSKDGLTYSEWYLPSKYELNLLYQNRNSIPGGFSAASYWSSTEFWDPATPLGILTSAWSQSFVTGAQTPSLKTNTFKVRAIRSF